MGVEDRVAYWQRRARDAERRLEFEAEHTKRIQMFADRAYTEQRRLADRLAKVAAAAVAKGIDPGVVFDIVDHPDESTT